MSRIGVFGGTFDPVHHGHLVMAQEAVVRLKLDETNRSGQLLAGLARAKGHIGFQANVGTARFRNVEIKELPSSD